MERGRRKRERVFSIIEGTVWPYMKHLYPSLGFLITGLKKSWAAATRAKQSSIGIGTSRAAVSAEICFACFEVNHCPRFPGDAVVRSMYNRTFAS